MTPTRDLDLAAFRAEVARRVNERLAIEGKRGFVTPLKVQRALSGGWDNIARADLIREIAAEVAREKGGGK